MTVEEDVTVVVLTHDRESEVLHTLGMLRALRDRPAICVVDNASTDGTSECVRAAFPDVPVIRLERNIGAAARNVGARSAATRYIAFCDDDTWWAPGALERAMRVLDAHPRLAAATGKVLVGARDVEDPTSTRMAASPLANDLGVPGTLVLGVMAGACMMRRDAFLAVGGYEPRLFIGGEEALLALDLMTAGWAMAYLPDVVVHHHPSPHRDKVARRRMLHRNALWCAWLRRPLRSAWRETRRLLDEARRDHALMLGLLDGLRGLPWVLAKRRVLPARVESTLQRVRDFYAGDWEERRFEALACRMPL